MLIIWGVATGVNTYQKSVFHLVRGIFVVVPIFAILITISNAFDHPLRSSDIGAIIFIILIGIAGFLFTGLIQRLIGGR
jgi:hypothetical protein